MCLCKKLTQTTEQNKEYHCHLQSKMDWTFPSTSALVIPSTPWYITVFPSSLLKLLSAYTPMSQLQSSVPYQPLLNVQLVGKQLLICLELKVPQDLSPVAFNHLSWCLPSGLRTIVHMRYSWLCLSVCIIPACIIHPATMSWIVSLALLQSLQLACCQLC